jgi:TetR/AcrR family transcriptional regulator, transcriptional repressor of aconitase
MAHRPTVSSRSSSGRDVRAGGSPPETSPGQNHPNDARVLSSTRGRILTAAERLFAERGFSGTSMPAIAKASRITAGAIYRHFDSKADLFFEVVRRTVQSIPMPEAAGSTSGAAFLPRIAAMYTTAGLKLLRQLAVEIHSASVKHPRVRRLLRRSLELTIRQMRDEIADAQQAGKLDPTLDPELLASAAMVFIMGLMHMETLLPHLVGDVRWHDFVQTRTAALMGLR